MKPCRINHRSFLIRIRKVAIRTQGRRRGGAPPLPPNLPGATGPAAANPYATPQTQPYAAAGQRNYLPELDTKQLKKLFNDCQNIRALIGLWTFLGLPANLIIAIMYVVLAVQGMPAADAAQAAGGVFVLLFGAGVAILAFLLQAVTVYFGWRRHELGRILGIVCCALMLPGFPVGTLIGALGLVAFIRSGERYFGPNGIDYKQLKREYKRRKKNKIA